MKLSAFGENFADHSGINELMADLGEALAGDQDLMMLGGGNPSQIPEVQTIFRQQMLNILDTEKEFENLVGNYDSPKGEKRFAEALARLFKKEYGWNISAKNIAITNGSQSACFILFNLLAGKFSDGSFKKVLFPIASEYIGYADQGIDGEIFTACKPTIEYLDDHTFKYRVDFHQLNVDDDINAICVSRPTNPTGNVLTDEEIHKLDKMARERDIPLIIDNAYGTPFPNIIFTEAEAIWNENIILSMSLSKLGLPGCRTGILIANEKLIEAVAATNAIQNLSTGSFGPTLALNLIDSGEVTRISRDIIKPYYQQRAQQASDWFHEAMADLPHYIHKAEGAIFLWLWFPDLPITSNELYQRLKQRGVLVVSGSYFFPGLEEDWQHTRECIRVTYSQEPALVKKAIGIIAEEVRLAYKQNTDEVA